MTPAATCSQAAFAAALLDPDQPCPPGLRAWNGSDPTARLAVYRNNVVGSLIDALADTFPVAQELVGEAFFRAMAGVFARQAPPRSRILAHYGEGFAEFIEAVRARAVRALPGRRGPARAGVRAGLSRCRCRAGRERGRGAGPGERRAHRRTAARLPSVGDGTELRPTPSCRCGPRTRARAISARSIPTTARRRSSCARTSTCLVLRLPPGAAEFVAAIQQGECLGEAAAAAMNAAAGLRSVGDAWRC